MLPSRPRQQQQQQQQHQQQQQQRVASGSGGSTAPGPLPAALDQGGAVRAAAETVAARLSEAVNGPVQRAFERERGAEEELRAVAAAVRRHEELQARWAAAAQPVTEALKEIGDVENWLCIIEDDMEKIARVVLTVSTEVMPG